VALFNNLFCTAITVWLISEVIRGQAPAYLILGAFGFGLIIGSDK